MSGPEPPLALLAELTHRCPLQCPYCSNPLELHRAGEELDTHAWLDVLDQAAALGILQIHFSGGEPTVRGDLEDLVARAESLGLYTNLITSAVLLDRDRLARLADRGLQHVQISFQAAGAEAADRIGGFSGGHAKKLAVARMVRELDLPLTVNAVMHRRNMDDLPRMIDMAVELDAKRLEVAHVQYYGWALRNRAALLPTPAQLDEATRIVEAAIERLKGILVIDFVVPDYYARRPKACMGGWGRRFLNVTPAGRVLPCHAAETIPGLEFETVKDRPLADIWRSSDAFNRFRGTDWMPEPCRSCDQREVDWGGCRCQALAIAGDAAATDPACELAPGHGLMQRFAAAETEGPEAPFQYRRIGGAAGEAQGRPSRRKEETPA